MILHVNLLSQKYIYSVFLRLLKMHAVLWHLQFLVSCGKAAIGSVHILLHPRFLSRLLSGWYRKWHWVAAAQRFKTPLWYTQYGSNMPVHNWHTSKPTNLNALINHILQNTSSPFQIFCSFRPSDSSMPSFRIHNYVLTLRQ